MKKRLDLGVIWGVFFIVAGTVVTPVAANTLYSIADRKLKPTLISVYDILGDDSLVHSKDISVPYRVSGGEGIAIDTESETLFVTQAWSPVIEMADANSLQALGSFTVLGATNLAGIVYDHEKKRVYTINRDSNKLFVLDWDARWHRLTPVEGSPFVLVAARGIGIALDEARDILFVANGDKVVFGYDTVTWQRAQTVTLSRPAVVVAVDAKEQYLYTGAGFLSDTCLVQYDLLFGIQKEREIRPNYYGAMGLAVDNETGNVFLSTGNGFAGGNFELIGFNQLLQEVSQFSTEGNPVGLAIPGWPNNTNPLRLEIEIVSGTVVIDDVHYAYPGDEVVYEIRFSNDHRVKPITGVTVTNKLPAELIFLRDEAVPGGGGLGYYQPGTHSYAVYAPQLDPATTRAYRLVMRVATDITPDLAIEHSVTASSKESGPVTAMAELYSRYMFVPLELDKGIVQGANIVDGIYYVEAGADLVYDIKVENKHNPWPLTGTVVLDELPLELTYQGFVAPNDVSAVYYEDRHLVVFSVPRLDPNSVRQMQIKMHVPETLQPDLTVLNMASATSEQSNSVVRADIRFIVTPHHDPLKLVVQLLIDDPNIVVEGDKIYVRPGQQLRYAVLTGIGNNIRPVTDIINSAGFSPGLEFVTFEPNENGHFDGRNYIWNYPQLVPGSSGEIAFVTVKVKEDVMGGAILVTDFRAVALETPVSTALGVVHTRVNDLESSMTVETSLGHIIRPGKIGCVHKGEEITYTLCVGNPLNTSPVPEVTVVVAMPFEVEVSGSDPNDAYDPGSHMVAIGYPYIAAGGEQCIRVWAKVRETIPLDTLFKTTALFSGRGVSATKQVIDLRVCPMDVLSTRMVYPALTDGNDLIMIRMEMPPSVNTSDIDLGRPMVLSPGNVHEMSEPKAEVYGTDGKVLVRVFFDPRGLIEATEGFGSVPILIRGYFTSGGIFQGKSEFFITRQMR